jgi:Na+/melibiose symporter-like transporter
MPSGMGHKGSRRTIVEGDTPIPASPARQPGPLINRNFGLLWSGALISFIGDFLFNTTLILWVQQDIARHKTWAPLAVSGVLAVFSVPILLAGPLAGVFVDRWDKRRTMLLMDALSAVIVALLLLATNLVPLPFVPGGRLTPIEQLVVLYVDVFLVGVCSQFFAPARMALIGDLVAEPQRARASALMQSVLALGLVLGPALAGPVYFGLGVQWALLVDSLSFVVSFLTILAVRAPRAARSVVEGQRGNLLGEYAEGVRFFVGNRVLMALLLTGIIAMLGAGILNSLDIFFVTTNLHAAAAYYGDLSAANGAGDVIGALLATVVLARIGSARAVWLSILAIGVLMTAYSRLTSLPPAIAVTIVVGVPNAWINAAFGPLLLHVTPRALIGRVSAILSPVLTLMSLLATALAGYLASTVLAGLHDTIFGVTFGTYDTLIGAGGVLCVLGGLYGARSLRGVRLEGEGRRRKPNAPVPVQAADSSAN